MRARSLPGVLMVMALGRFGDLRLNKGGAAPRTYAAIGNRLPSPLGAADPWHAPYPLIELGEPNPPEGAEPVVWRLLTTHVATDAADAWQIVDWDRMRWLIEQFFRTVKKTGLSD